MHLTVIPGGLTSQLQLLDVSVNKPFKGFMQEEWAKWIEAPIHHITPAGRVNWPSISNVCKRVKNSWQRVKSETIVKSLKKCGINNALDQRFSNFFQVGTSFISQNVLRTTLLLGLSNSLGLP